MSKLFITSNNNSSQKEIQKVSFSNDLKYDLNILFPNHQSVGQVNTGFGMENK